MDRERRAVISPIELRAAAGDAGKGETAVGYAAVFNSPARIGDWFVETIAPGAFADTLRNDDVLALVDHDIGRVLGRSSAGTLRLSEDGQGLKTEIDLPDTGDGRDLAVLLKRGDIKGMSFGFRVTKESWEETDDLPLRTIMAVQLFEVTATAMPAYDSTSLALRDLVQRGLQPASASPADIDQRRANFMAAQRRLNAKVSLDLHLRGGSKAVQ